MFYDTEMKISTHAGKHGDHPLGGAIGAAVGALAGVMGVAAIKATPFESLETVPGLAAGIIIGGIVGALFGKWAAQEINPTTEDIIWNKYSDSRHFIEKDSIFDSYGPAYRHGFDADISKLAQESRKVAASTKLSWTDDHETLSSWEHPVYADNDCYGQLHERIREYSKT